jgi:hypothetical protein
LTLPRDPLQREEHLQRWPVRCRFYGYRGLRARRILSGHASCRRFPGGNNRCQVFGAVSPRVPAAEEGSALPPALRLKACAICVACSLTSGLFRPPRSPLVSLVASGVGVGCTSLVAPPGRTRLFLCRPRAPVPACSPGLPSSPSSILRVRTRSCVSSRVQMAGPRAAASTRAPRGRRAREATRAASHPPGRPRAAEATALFP